MHVVWVFNNGIIKNPDYMHIILQQGFILHSTLNWLASLHYKKCQELTGLKSIIY